MSIEKEHITRPIWSINYEEGKSDGKWYSFWTVNYYFADDNAWKTVYCTQSYEWAKIALDKYKDCLDSCCLIPTLKNLSPVMFERADQMYRITNINLEHGVVFGEQIRGNKFYGDTNPQFSENGFDYIKEDILFHQFGDAVVKNNQLFLNGNLVLNTESFEQICQNVNQRLEHIGTHPTNLIKYIVSTYDNVRRYICGDFSYNNINTREEFITE